MKLSDAMEFVSSFRALWDRVLPFACAEAICDIMPVIEEQAEKYASMFNRAISLYGVPDADNPSRYTVPENQAEAYAEEMQRINGMEYTTIVKKTIPKIPDLSPKELYALREFFDFE